MQLLTKKTEQNALEKFFEFMNKYKTQKNDWTHRFKCEPYGNFKIDDDAYDKMMVLYSDAVVAGFVPHLVEKHILFGPIVIELIFKSDNRERCYTEELIKKIILVYNKIITKYININNLDIEILVLETLNPINKKEKYIDSLRIIYPNICATTSTQFKIRKEVIILITKNNILKNAEEIFSEGTIYQNDWLMYGSRLYLTSEVPKITHIYNTANGKIFDTLIPGEKLDAKMIKYLVQQLSVRKFKTEAEIFLLKNNNPADVPQITSTNNTDCVNVKNIIFGTENINYSVEKLKQMIWAGDIELAKIYVEKYFIKIANPVEIAWWVPSENKIMNYKFEDVKKLLIPDLENGNFNLHKWFFGEYSKVYIQNIDVNMSRIYEKNNQLYLNLFSGFMHTYQKKYDDYPNDIKNKVELIWNHIKNIWCSGQENIFVYNKNWICHMVSGRKMTTCIYLRSGQGTGKSLVTEFLKFKVLGQNIVYITSNSDCVSGFNYQLSGKILLVLEELPSLNKNQWCTVSNALKHLITGATFTVKEKHKSDFEATNNLSIIISTNNNAIKIEADDRRFVVNDISHEKVGDTAYFNKIHEATDNNLVGEAFYWYCREYAAQHKDFKEFPPPLSNTKKDLIIENLHSLFEYIKEEYIKSKKDIDIAFSEFYNNYVEYIKNKKLDVISKIAVGKLLTVHKLGLTNGTGNIKCVKISCKELYKIFNNKNWIHEVDDIHIVYQ